MAKTVSINTRFWISNHRYLKTLSSIMNISINDLVNGILCKAFETDCENDDNKDLKTLIDNLPLAKAKKIMEITEE